jgi:hypothetical protein
MSALINVSIDVTKLPKEKFVVGKKGTYYNFTLSVNDDSRFGNNVSVYDAQSKEERDAKKPKDFLGNGSVFWTDGSIVVAEKEVKETAPVAVEEDTDDLPF